jgi:hypothetical protein
VSSHQVHGDATPDSGTPELAVSHDAVLNAAPTIHIAPDDENTRRIPRVLLAQAQRRQRRIASVIVPIVALLAAAALGVTMRNQNERPSAVPAAPGNEQTQNPNAPATVASEAAPSVASAAAPAAASAPAASTAPTSRNGSAEPPDINGVPAPSSPPSATDQASPSSTAAPARRVRAGASSRPSSAKSEHSKTSNPKTPSTAKGSDLLDFQGPAPK